MNHLDNLILRYPALSECREQIQTAFEIMREAYRADKKLLVCGNGGSASDSEHIVGELMKEFSIRRPLDQQMKTKLLEAGDEDGMLAQNLQGALPAITLTENCALSTAYANDAVPILNFAQQVYGYGTENDVLLGISTSGNSQNVVYAIKTAKAKGMHVIGLTGKSGGCMRELCDVAICVPETETYRIQELHLPVYHCLCLMIEEEFFG
ncbi:MAG: phosphoheptose isomerase [Lachnospiraceae bacterium]|jgi:D-sedoheptulose 7-phosphate isomerase|nr:MAG: phosphoheptose isomerase [Lachnospiraceae bacterium]